jgi:hypothetical protein
MVVTIESKLTFKFQIENAVVNIVLRNGNTRVYYILTWIVNGVVSNRNKQQKLAVYGGRFSKATKYTVLISRAYFSIRNRFLSISVYIKIVFTSYLCVIHEQFNHFFVVQNTHWSIQRKTEKFCKGVFHGKCLSYTSNYMRNMCISSAIIKPT